MKVVNRTKELELLYNIFLASEYEPSNISDQDLELLKSLFRNYRWTFSSASNPMKKVLDYIYESDDIKLLKKMLHVQNDKDAQNDCGTDFDISYASVEFMPFDDNANIAKHLKDDYGEIGDLVYHICTANYKHIFTQSSPFSKGIYYEGSEEREKNEK